MRGLLANPELIRNVRIQVRVRRMIAAVVVCAALSLAAGFSLYYAGSVQGRPAPEWGVQFMTLVISVQVFALLIGGGITCLQAIQREKDLNTFDFQRITRLTPLELTLGKLFGAPALVYFIVVCLVPGTLVGAVAGAARTSFVLAAYVALVVGSIAYHAFALTISMLVERGGAVPILVFLFVAWFPSSAGGFILRLGALSPGVATNLVHQTSWVLTLPSGGTPLSRIGTMTDVFFGWPVHHFFVFVVLAVTFTAWFLLAVVRNIKRDPAVYELYTPPQALGLALYVNLVLVGFFDWSVLKGLDAQAVLLLMNTFLFFVLGLVLIRNRDRLRQVQSGESSEPKWLTLSWPAPYLLAGTVGLGLIVTVMAQAHRDVGTVWDLHLATFRTVALAFWVIRDILYLQWMALRRGRRALAIGILYQVVFYTCVGILVVAFHLLSTGAGKAIAIGLIPLFALAVSPGDWSEIRTMLLSALVVAALASAMFTGLQRQRVTELSASPPA